MYTRIGITLASTLALALAGCNDSSGGSGGGGGGFNDTVPTPPTSARSSRSIEPKDDAGELSKMFAGSLKGELPTGGSVDNVAMLTNAIEARSGQSDNNLSAFIDRLLTQMELSVDRRQLDVAMRNDEFDDDFDDDFLEEMFDELCTSGSASFSLTDNSVSLDFNSCRIDMEEFGESRLTGGFSLTSNADELTDIYADTCSDSDVTADFKANDFWVRTYDGDGTRIESLFMSADISFGGSVSCDTEEGTTFLKGSHFVIDIDDEWFGLYDMDNSIEVGPEEVGADINFKFDSSDQDGSFEILTREQYKQKIPADDTMGFTPTYPYAGEIIFRAGGQELVYTFDGSEPNPTDQTEVTIAGRSASDPADVSCTGNSSWAQMNNGQAKCE